MSDFYAIQRLNDWSNNYQVGVNPFCIFIDMIGYSEDRYGEEVYSGETLHQCCGYLELTMISDALKCFEDNGFDAVFDFIDSLDNDSEYGEVA